MKKISIKRLAKLLMEEKKPIAKTEEEDTESFGKDFLSKSWGDDEEADPKLDFVDESRWADIAGIESLHEQADAGDTALQQAMDIFGAGALVDEQGGEVVIDTGVTDTDIEEMYDQWISVWPDGMHEEGGLIYTGVMV